MRFVIAISDPIADLIQSWMLPIEVEDDLLGCLEGGISQFELSQLSKVPAPSPTFILNLETSDPLVVAGTHYFTFWLVFGPNPNHLYVHNCEHRYDEDWSDQNAEYQDYADPPDYPEESWGEDPPWDYYS